MGCGIWVRGRRDEVAVVLVGRRGNEGLVRAGEGAGRRAGRQGKGSRRGSGKGMARVRVLIEVEPIDIRENGKAIDRVNMYASCES